jgi:hypothetical protein
MSLAMEHIQADDMFSVPNTVNFKSKCDLNMVFFESGLDRG